MKHYLATTAAALFLIAAPAAFAQNNDGAGNSDSSSGAAAGSNTGGGTGTDTGGSDNNTDNGGAANNNDANATTGGNTDVTGSINQNDSSCSDVPPHAAFSTISPKCREAISAWTRAQVGSSVVFSGDLAEGTVLPDTVEIIEVPAYRDYGYAYLNDRRVLVDRSNRTVIHLD